MTTKFCKKCETEKPGSDFYRSRANSGGRQNYCKLCQRAAATLWRRENPGKHKATRKKQRERNADTIRAQHRDYYRNRRSDELKAKAKVSSLALYRTLRLAAIQHLGARCSRCGFDNPRALQIDHINSDGAAERATIGNQRILKRVLESAVGDQYQCVCANCNWILRHERGEHKARSA